MKKFILSLLIIGGFTIVSFSQDIIFKTDGSRDIFNLEAIDTTNNKPMNETENKKGYIAISIGSVFPMGDFGNRNIQDPKAGLANMGIQLNLVNIGYRLSKNIGIAGLLGGAVHSVEYIDEATWSYGYFLAGVLFTFPSQKVDFDLRILGGFMNAKLNRPSLNAEANGDAFGYDIGAVVRSHISQKTSFLFSIDYAGGNPSLESHFSPDFSQNIKNITLAVGIAFRLN